MTILQNSADGIDLGYCGAAHKPELPWHREVLEEGARCCIVPLDGDAEFLHSTAKRAGMVMIRVQMRNSWIRAVAKDADLFIRFIL